MNKEILQLLSKINNHEITLEIWNNASDYAKNDLKRKAIICIDAVLKELEFLNDELGYTLIRERYIYYNTFKRLIEKF